MKDTTGKKTVLVVDDDIDYLNQIRLQLEAAGFEVLTAEGQKAAEDILRRRKPDLAVVDLMMEHQDSGFVLCYHLKKKDPALPVILVTAVTSETGLEFDATTEEERSWIKADRVLAKPIRYEQLFAEIERLIGKS